METRNPSGDIEFSRKSRGYDPDEVDRFVTSVRGELGDLQDKLRRLEAGRGTAGRRDGGKLHDPDRAVERMLAAAQQTADRVVFDAEAEADRLISEAETEAERLVTDAQSQSRHRMAEVEAQGEKIRREAVTEARRVVEETRQPLAREVRKLRTTRDGLRAEIEMLKRFLGDHRGRVRAIGDSLRSMADDPAALRVGKLTDPTPIDVDVSDDFEIEVGAAPAAASKQQSAAAPAKAPAQAAAPAAAPAAQRRPAAVVVEDTVDDVVEVSADNDIPEVEWADADLDETPSDSAYSAADPDADDAVGSYGSDDDAADMPKSDADDNVISGAFASVIGDDDGGADAEGSGDRFRDAVQAAKESDLGSQVPDAGDASGFFESQIDDPS